MVLRVILEIRTKWHIEKRPLCVFGTEARQSQLEYSRKPATIQEAYYPNWITLELNVVLLNLT